MTPQTRTKLEKLLQLAKRGVGGEAIYKKALKDEMALTFSAFVQRNRIFPAPDPEEEEKPSSLSAEDLEKLISRMSSMDRVTVRKQLGG